MAALILRPPRRSPPPAPPRPRATLGGTSAEPSPPPAPIGLARRRAAAALIRPVGAPEPHFRVGAPQAGDVGPRLGGGGATLWSQSQSHRAIPGGGGGELSSQAPRPGKGGSLGPGPAKVTPE